MSETKFGTFEELLELATEELRPIVIRLKVLILEIHPETCEVVRLGDKAATFGVGPKKMSEGYAYIMPHKNWINLGFYKGALFADQSEMMEGTGKSLRHIKMRSLEDANQPEVRSLLKAAYEERKSSLGL